MQDSIFRRKGRTASGEGSEESLGALTYNPQEGFQVQIWWSYFVGIKPMNFNFPFNIGSLPASHLCCWAMRLHCPAGRDTAQPQSHSCFLGVQSDNHSGSQTLMGRKCYFNFFFLAFINIKMWLTITCEGQLELRIRDRVQ